MEAPSELLLEALRGLKVGAPKGAAMERLETFIVIFMQHKVRLL